MRCDPLGWNLPGYVEELVSEVRGRTGFPMLVSEEVGVGYDSEMRIAGSGRQFHEIVVVPEYRDFRLHFLVSAARKVLRIWDQAPEERYVPATEVGRRLPAREEAQLRSKIQELREPRLQVLSAYIFQGVARQLTSMPVDIRVERELAATMPDHRRDQQRYLARQVHDLEPHFAPEIATITPDRVYAATTAMNVAFGEEAARLAGVCPSRVFRATPHRSLGTRLRESLESVHLPGARGDRVLTDMWAEELGMRGWYEWHRLDKTV